MKKNIKLTKEEKSILQQIERGEFVSSKSLKKDINHYAQIARNTVAKNKTISIRISEIDLLKLKALAIYKRVPYQTLITSSFHKLLQEKV